MRARVGMLCVVGVVGVMGFAVPAAHAATVSPTRFDDNPGSGCPADCSLRQAVAAANSGDTVQLSAGTYAVGTGEIPITKSILIAGAGARSTTVDAATTSRVFHVSVAFSVQISDLTIQNGIALDAEGGGILNDSPSITTINRVAMVSNSSFGVTTYSDGGAVANHGTFKAIDSLFQHNDASNASTNNNSATGGAIQNRAGGTLTVSNSTFSDNSVTTFFVGQSAGGGAVYVDQSAQASFANVTFEANLANGPAQQGGNIANSTQGTINFSNTIIADGYSPVVGTRNCSLFTPYVTSSGGNLETSNAQCITATTTDHVLASPALGPLTNNGGPTNTHRPGAGSDAFGFGDVGACAVETTDQRGGTRVIGGKCDSGAVQANSLADLSLTGALSAPGYGSPVTYSLIVTNNGPDAVLGATIAGANCTIGFLAAGASTPCMGSFSWNGDSAISQTFTVSGAYVDPAVGGNSITLTALAPRLTTVSLRPTTFAAARKGATIAAAAGAKIKFTGIDLAGLEATVQRPIKGNVKNGVCVKRKKGVKAKGRGCNLWSTVGTGKKTLTAQSGTVKFSGRVKKKALKAGTYRVMLVPVASNGAKGSPWPLTFKIKG